VAVAVASVSIAAAALRSTGMDKRQRGRMRVLATCVERKKEGGGRRERR
jgi:hypothetical protein